MLIPEVNIKSGEGWVSGYRRFIPPGAFLRCADVSGEYVGTWFIGYTSSCDCAKCEVWTGCGDPECFEKLPHEHPSPTRVRVFREFPAIGSSLDMRKLRFEDPPRPIGTPFRNVRNVRGDVVGTILSASAAPSAVMTTSSDALARSLFRVRMHDLIELRGEAAHCHKAYEWPQRIRAEAVLWEASSSASVRAECEAQAKAIVEEMERWKKPCERLASYSNVPIEKYSDPYEEREEFGDNGREVSINGLRVEFGVDEYDEFADE
jgi:hypothetical protein